MSRVVGFGPLRLSSQIPRVPATATAYGVSEVILIEDSSGDFLGWPEAMNSAGYSRAARELNVPPEMANTSGLVSAIPRRPLASPILIIDTLAGPDAG